MKLFKSREDSAQKLLANMPIELLKQDDWVVLSLSPTARMFARKIVKTIGADLEYFFSEKITAPNNKDCAIAVVSETQELVLNEPLIDAFEIELDYIYGEAKRKHDEKILADTYKYRKGEILKDLKGKCVLLVDEGADTGLTLMSALKTVMTMDVKKVCVAITVVPKSVVEELLKTVDDVYYAYALENYVSSRHYYETYEPPMVL